MNSRLFCFLTISLAASTLITSVEKASGQPIEHQGVEQVQHLVCVKEAQHLRCTVEKSKGHNQNEDAVQQDKAIKNNKSSLVTVVQAQSPNQQKSVEQEINQYWTTSTIVGLIFLVSICINGLGLFLYKKYCTNRVTVLRQNIEVLERLWKTSNIQ